MPQILVVDDDPFIRTLLRSLLGKEGHDVREARDGHEALRSVAAARPDLVLCDLFMPGLGGMQTISELARAAPGLPVVVMGGGAAERHLVALPAAARLGAAGGLDKPFSRTALLAVVKRVLAASQTGCPQMPSSCRSEAWASGLSSTTSTRNGGRR